METPIKFNQLQFAFINVNLIKRPDLEYNEINGYTGDVIKTMPTILPMNSGLPPEMPFVFASDENSGVRIHIAQNRVDLFINPNLQSLDVAISWAEKIAKRYSNLGIERVGVVANYIAKIDNPSDWMRKNLLNNRSSKWEELFLRFNIKSALDGIVINTMISFQEAEAIDNNSKYRCIIIQKDINTPINNVSRLDSSFVCKFIGEKTKKLSHSTIKGVIE